jgi:hypothetical protein
VLLFSAISHAETLTLGADLIQPVALSGWNVNFRYELKSKWLIGWSHGANIKIDAYSAFATSKMEQQNVNIDTSWSTGPEVGYMFAKNWDVRLAFKAHKSELNFLSNGEDTDYVLYTVGPTISYHWYPFSDNTKGFEVEFSGRYWFNVSNDLQGDTFSYLDADGLDQVHDPDDFWDGSLSGLGINVTFGYTF